MKTYSQKSAEIKREWYLIDAKSLPLGKLAVVIADKLMGKSKVTYTPHIDNGDYVVVINAKDIVVTGNKMTDKMYHRHSGFPGGLTSLKLEEVIEKDPSYAIKEAVKGMLPKNKLAADRLARLRVFDGAEHTHAAQNPKEIK
ncbi:50S ribosomal protein L13 [Candidatus Saccharibacteria bacterium]|jgi:large subunit ribosomal protein L13|nr:50S ribosomal protein L13 [Candidatus Saccharibacteria bacterium]